MRGLAARGGAHARDGARAQTLLTMLAVAPPGRQALESTRLQLAAFPLAAVDASFTASRCGGPRLELAGQHHPRRRVLAALLLSSSLPPTWPQPACATLPSAAANGLPLLGRFEALKGATSFIGTWQLGGPESAGPRGVLSLLRRGHTLN